MRRFVREFGVRRQKVLDRRQPREEEDRSEQDRRRKTRLAELRPHGERSLLERQRHEEIDHRREAVGVERETAEHPDRQPRGVPVRPDEPEVEPQHPPAVHDQHGQHLRIALRRFRPRQDRGQHDDGRRRARLPVSRTPADQARQQRQQRQRQQRHEPQGKFERQAAVQQQAHHRRVQREHRVRQRAVHGHQRVRPGELERRRRVLAFRGVQLVHPDLHEREGNEEHRGDQQHGPADRGLFFFENGHKKG